MASEPFFRIGEVDLFGLGLIYFSTGYLFLDLILVLIPVIYWNSIRTLTGPTWRSRTRRWLQEGRWTTAYTGLLWSTQARLRLAFGRSFSMKALDMCFRLAVVYASATLFVAPKFEVLATHLWAFAMAASAGAAGFYGARWLKRRSQPSPFDPPESKSCRANQILENGAYLLIMAVLVTAGELGAPWLVTGPFGMGAAVGAGLAFAVPASVLAFVMYVLRFGDDLGGGMFVFLVMFPCLNAIFDWPSWAASRWLMKRLRWDASRPVFYDRVGRLFGHVLADALIGVACLFALAAAIAIMSETNSGIMEWDSTFSKAQHAPFSGDGVVLTIMLFSTLVPTAIHLFFAVFALAFIETPYRNVVARFLEDENGGEEWANQAIVAVYLTAWATFSLVVVWLGAEGLVAGLDTLWVEIGFAAETDPQPLWSSLFRSTDAIAKAVNAGPPLHPR